MLKRVLFHLLRPTPGWVSYVTCTAVHKAGMPACRQTNPRSFGPSGWDQQNSRGGEGGLSPAGGEQPPASTFCFSPEHPAAGMQGCSSAHHSRTPTISTRVRGWVSVDGEHQLYPPTEPPPAGPPAPAPAPARAVGAAICSGLTSCRGTSLLPPHQRLGESQPTAPGISTGFSIYLIFLFYFNVHGNPES